MATYYPQNELEERIAETMNPPVPSSTACRNCYGEGVRKGGEGGSHMKLGSFLCAVFGHQKDRWTVVNPHWPVAECPRCKARYYREWCPEFVPSTHYGVLTGEDWCDICSQPAAKHPVHTLADEGQWGLDSGPPGSLR